VLKNAKKTDAERTFAGASLAVRASAADIDRAFELGRKDTNVSRIIGKLTDKQGLFASERLLPDIVPDAQQPEEDRMPKWDYNTLDELLNDPKIQAALPMSAARVGAPFEDTLRTLDASEAVKRQLRRAVVEPLKSCNVPKIVAWLKRIVNYSPDTLFKRLRSLPRPVEQDLAELKQSVGAR
jgi:hypothetical protein